MDHHPVVMNGTSGSWTIHQGIEVAFTFLGQYYAGHGVIVRVTSTNPLLALITVIEVSDAIKIPLPFPVDDVRHLSQCAGKEIIWEVEYLVPYAQVDVTGGIGCRLIPSTQCSRPQSQYLDLEVDMEVVLLVRTTFEDHCVGLGIFLECSLQGTWEGFRIPQSYYVVVRLTAVFSEFSHHASSCEIPGLKTLVESVGYRILWSSYRVQPAQSSTSYVLSSQGSATSVGDVPTSNAKNSTSPESSVGRQPTRPVEEDIGVHPSGPSDQGSGRAEQLGAGDHQDGFACALSYPDKPLWRGKYYLLLNDDFFVHGRAFIQVCLPDEPFDEDVLGDTDVGVMYVSENNDFQMTPMHWPLTHVRLEGGRLLSEIILFCSENAPSNGSDDGLDGMKKNQYRLNVRRKLLRSNNCTTTKLYMKTSPEEVRKVSSIRCCVEKCCQTFDWKDTMKIQRKFHAGSFAARSETGYSVLGQLHDLLGTRKKFITLANRDVCENAWYIIHGLLRSTFSLYKSAERVGSGSGCHGNLGVLRPRAHTIQAEANMMTIINDTANRMPNATWEIGQKRVDNQKILPSACNWDHIRVASNHISLLALSVMAALNSVIAIFSC
jgi:hypothetical protein